MTSLRVTVHSVTLDYVITFFLYKSKVKMTKMSLSKIKNVNDYVNLH